MTEKSLAETKVRTISSCCKNGINKKEQKWYQQEKNTLIRTSFEELKTSICWL